MAFGQLEAYIPGDRRRALASGTEMPDRVRGSALFLDISGFTPLTEALARELGPQRGAEELTSVLNTVFDAVLSVLHRYGGSVLYFSGDAVTCWLDGDDGHLGISCGLEMQEAMSKVSTVRSPGGTTIEIAMKVSIAAGPARRFVVGDPDVQLIDVLAGALMDRLAATEQRAERGQVVIDGPTLDSLSGGIETAIVHGEGSERVAVVAAVASLPFPGTPPLRPKLPRSISRQWLLPSVFERMRAGSGEFLTELRPAVPMFIRFGGIDYDQDGDAQRRLDEFIRRVQWVVDGQGGNLLSLTIGDKGAYLYAIFGSPNAHEDDAARACAAALDVLAIEGETAATGIQVGIASGSLWSGPFGHAQRKTFNCFGDATNLAARLMSAAPPGQAYVTVEVARASGGRFLFEERPDFKPKGKSELVPIRRLTGVDRRAPIRERRAQHELVGRGEEMALLKELADQALAGRGRVVALAAEAGMGKSRLADEILGSIREAGVAVHSGAAASVGGSSYQAWQGVWTTLLGVEHDDDPLPDLERSLAATDPDLLPRLPLLGNVLGVAIEDNELTASFDAKLRKTSLESLLLRYLTCHAARVPMVLFLDDCHWIDALSKDLLDLVARAVQSLPVLVLLTYRPGAFAAPRLAHTTVLDLDRLDDDSCKQLLTDRLTELYGPDRPPSEALMDHLVGRAEGNPFFLEELANFLHSEGADPAGADAASLNLPSTLSSLVLSRIDTLGESSRQTLKVASVVGREFGLTTLTGSYPDLGDRRQVTGHLRRLTTADLVIHEDPVTDFYAFKHAVIREVAYESLPFALRAVLHGRVGHWIETTEPDALDLLAYHYWMSGDEPKKREYLRKAGDAAEARYANEAAIDYYRRLLTVLADDERGSILLKLGKILELAGELEEAEHLSVEAIVLAERAGDNVAAAWARTSRAEPMRKQSRYDEAEAELETAWQAFEKEGESSGCGRVAHIRGLIANLQGDSERSWTQFEQALTISRARGDRRTEATLLSNLAMPAAMQGRYELAQDLTEQALVIRNELGDRWGIGVSLNNIGMLAYLRQDYARARAPLEEAVTWGEQAGDSYGVAVAQHNLGNTSRQLGDSASAGKHYAEALRIYSLLGDRTSLTMLFDDIAMLLAAGSPGEAFRLSGASDTLRESVGSPRPDYQEKEFEEAMAVARARLGESAGDEQEAGRRLDVDAAIALALTACGATTSQSPEATTRVVKDFAAPI
jgi:class 3 adenylate cyclase/tetratricopeptide (TPR) repeat protein